MDWETALTAVVKDYVDQPHSWGQRDCCQFAAAYVKARTGTDHAAKFPVYDSKDSAAWVLDRAGDISAVVDQCLGPKKNEPVEAGDVVLCHVLNLQIVGVCNGYAVWCFVDEKGLCRVNLKTVVAAWSV